MTAIQTRIFNEFFEAISEDPRVGPMHISLYMALLFHASMKATSSEIKIFSRQIMPIAKFSSRATYDRTMHDLHDFGYIKYEPSHDAFCGSQVEFVGQ